MIMKAKKTNSTMILFIGIFFFGPIAGGVAAEPASKLLMDFSDASVARQWQSVNDGVMGGISEGNFSITDDKTLEFSGTLSLENNGGFASIRTRPADLGLDGYDTIAARIKGDGRTYSVNLRTASRRAAGSYRAPIETEKNRWIKVRIPLENFQYTAYGRRVAAAPLRAKDIQSVGFTLSDKQPGPFKMEVRSIWAEKSRSDLPATNANQAEEKDIVDTAVAAGGFNTLVAAVKAAGLVEALKAEGPLTVFAPSDDAFAKLPKGTVERLLEPENRDELVAILTYHVLPGKLLLGVQSLETLQGQSISIKPSGSFEVNGANVVASDIAASNGVIHVIDSVLIPSRATLTPQESARALIQLAIQRGVPIFNAGQASACAAIYEVAIESLLKSYKQVLDDRDRAVLERALREIRSETQSPTEQAWTLRRALDVVYESLSDA
jgi:uncharacterized surface protein with fasciclin (FAS1) repeats